MSDTPTITTVDDLTPEQKRQLQGLEGAAKLFEAMVTGMVPGASFATAVVDNESASGEQVGVHILSNMSDPEGPRHIFRTLSMQEEDKKAVLLMNRCRQWFEDNNVRSAESVYQMDSVVVKASEFMEMVGDIIGYPGYPDEEEE